MSHIISPKLMGGLGNQLFQIANAYARSKQYGYQLVVPNSSFIATYKNGRKADGNPVGNYANNILAGFPQNKIDARGFSVIKERGFNYQTLPAPKGNTIYDGYFQSAKYFEAIEVALKSKLAPSSSFQRYTETLIPSLRSRSCIALHVRRGDSLANPSIHPTLHASYYIAALSALGDTPATTKLIFTTDIEWVRENLPLKNSIHVASRNDYEELWAMSLSQKLIIANSSFSWWAAYLSPFGAEVIAPSMWFGPDGPTEHNDIYLASWKKVPVRYELGELVAT